MIAAFAELSGESPPLAALEAVSAAEALGGRALGEGPYPRGLVAVELPDRGTVARWAERLALARRTLVLLRPGPGLEAAAAREGASGAPAAFRRLGRPSETADATVRSLGRSYRDGGGRIDLERPVRRFWLAEGSEPPGVLLEEVAPVDRASVARRRMPLLPFRRPVSLPPRLARAAANLARVRPGDRVLDPFLGTGALAAEAGLLGARLYGIDRDPTMMRGAVRNLTYLGVSPVALLVGDAGEAEFPDGPPWFDAILTDPPYGRSSGTGGESPSALLGRVLPRWGQRLAPSARIVLIVPSGAPELPPPWRGVAAVPVRVHRSLTREFRVYERAGATAGP